MSIRHIWLSLPLILVNVLHSTPSMLYFAAVGIFLVLSYMALHHYFGRNRYNHAPPTRVCGERVRVCGSTRDVCC